MASLAQSLAPNPLPSRFFFTTVRPTLNPNPLIPRAATFPHHWVLADSPNSPPLDRKPLVPKTTSIHRIVHRLRRMDVNETKDDDQTPIDGQERLGELFDWGEGEEISQKVLPWERDENFSFDDEGESEGLRRKRVKEPSLAELSIERSELRRLRKEAFRLREWERITVPKAGATRAIGEKIHGVWRKSELVKLKFHEELAHNMKKAHELVECRTGGLVIWRSGSVMVVYRGNNYKRPSRSHSDDASTDTDSSANADTAINSTNMSEKGESLFISDVSGASKLDMKDATQLASSKLEQTKESVLTFEHTDSLTEEEVEYSSLLDSLGPRFVDWWGSGILPVDADLLPEKVPGYKTPLRLLPTGVRPCLTEAEMTNMRKMAKSLPCHFALGRNRNHQGLASAILKLWEKSLVVKIAVKRGVQNTNNKLMAEELKALTGGMLLLRNKFYIIMYRGKDFVPSSVATALAEREELTKDIQDAEEKSRNYIMEDSDAEKLDVYAPVGTLAEFREAQARWGINISTEEHTAMKEEASRSKNIKLFRKLEHKLSIAQAKKLRAEKLLAKIESFMVPINPSEDQETITVEERSVFRRIGLRMKAYLPLGVRGVFGGVIENMHLHWKHRELVKLITKQKTLSFVEDTARLLEYESGGILVAIERVPKGFALVYYRGKNYKRPVSIRPRNLLTKAKALKRAVSMQRHEALSQHIMELERSIKEMKQELGFSIDEECAADDEQLIRYPQAISKFENEESCVDSEQEHETDSDEYLVS